MEPKQDLKINRFLGVRLKISQFKCDIPSVCAKACRMASSLRVNQILTLCLLLATIILANTPNTSGLRCWNGTCFLEIDDCSVPSKDYSPITCPNFRGAVCGSTISVQKLSNQIITSIEGICAVVVGSDHVKNKCKSTPQKAIDDTNNFLKEQREKTGEADDGSRLISSRECSCDTEDYCNDASGNTWSTTEAPARAALYSSSSASSLNAFTAIVLASSTWLCVSLMNHI